jgi:hypothetical protein
MGFNIHILSVRNRSTNLPGHAALAASFNPNRFNLTVRCARRQRPGAFFTDDNSFSTAITDFKLGWPCPVAALIPESTVVQIGAPQATAGCSGA